MVPPSIYMKLRTGHNSIQLSCKVGTKQGGLVAMLDKIKEIILGSQDFSVDTGVPRQLNIKSKGGSKCL